jgi:outer membrane protein OmpA-like peptidoglycan-associated protein
MSQYFMSKQKITIIFMMLMFAAITGHTQTIKRTRPVWWFGESVAANFNYYRGTTQMLNGDFSTPTAFHKGYGVKPYISLLTEYRPNRTWGGMLNIAYDGRGGKFKTVLAPCNCPADLSTNISYLAIEPSLRLAPFGSAFYVFAGPTLGINLRKEYKYTQEKQVDRTGEWSGIHKVVLSAQAGAGVDIPLSAKRNLTQMTLSPFASFQTDFGHEPRLDGEWSFYTIRTGLAFKFGTARRKTPIATVAEPVVISEKEVQFSVRAPKVVPLTRQVKETFPLLNSVFFDMSSTEIPHRYVQLSNKQALSFKEEQLQQDQPNDLTVGRSARQLSVYYNILNIIGDRLRANPQSAIMLSGASDKDPAQGKIMAENIKQYLLTAFGINPSRISTEGRDKPRIPSEQPGVTKELALLREGDRRVDIESVSPELLMQVGGTTTTFMKPVQIMTRQEDPLDSHVLFNTDGAEQLLKSWSVEVIDDQGKAQHYGPYTKDDASVPGKTILGNNTQGNYKVVMTGETKTGHSVREESSVSLIKRTDKTQEGQRYSILFDFDRSKSITAYENFLTDIVTPLIPANGTVIIHGHTDVIGEEAYNHTLSNERADGARQILEQALANKGTTGVKFEVFGFGEDESLAPFENNTPEKRFYNRTVIIDIIPAN